MDVTNEHEPTPATPGGDTAPKIPSSDRDSAQSIQNSNPDGDSALTIPLIWDGEIAVVVRKPAGLLTESASSIDSLRERLRVQFASRTRYLVTVHRLDRDVSGLVLVAMTKRAARLLAEQFAARKVEKSYRAILVGRLEAPDVLGPDASQGCEVNRELRWTDRIVKCEGEARVAIAGEGDPGKVAETRVEIERYDADRDVTLVRMVPETGRMHQLRIQASSRGFPIVGDALYGAPAVEGVSTGDGETGRIALHATSLGFFDPRSGKRVTVQDREDPLAAMLGASG